MFYMRCDTCLQIGLRRPTCESCGSSRTSEWPDPEVRQLLTNIGIGYDRLGRIDVNDPTPHRVGVMLSAIALERLLEELLYTILYGNSDYNEVAILVEALMEAHEGRARMLALFAKVACGSFAQEATAVGFPKFFAEWETLVRERNTFVHGARRRRDITTLLVDLHAFGDDAIKVFAALNNAYVPPRL